jgi:hypothetical protein
VLDPARPGQDLLVLELVPGDLVPVMVEDHEPGAGRALVNRPDEISHDAEPMPGGLTRGWLTRQ